MMTTLLAPLKNLAVARHRLNLLSAFPRSWVASINTFQKPAEGEGA
jgi:hypothetical protein